MTLLSIGYMVRRGLGKSGSRDPYGEDRHTHRLPGSHVVKGRPSPVWDAVLRRAAAVNRAAGAHACPGTGCACAAVEIRKTRHWRRRAPSYPRRLRWSDTGMPAMLTRAQQPPSVQPAACSTK